MLNGRAAKFAARAVMSIPDQIESIGRALTAAEVAEHLHLHKLTVYRLAQSGALPHFRIASSIRFDPKAVAAYLRAHSIGGVDG